MTDAKNAGPALAHMVYFTLKESNEQTRANLIASCDKYLSGHQGCTYYAAGTLVPDLTRPVNDREFDVALHVIFASRADHDRYQTDPRHLQYIAENKESWAKVRVFDAYVPV